MKALDLKLLRDLWRMRGQAFAIALVLAAATATFVLSMGVHRSLTETRDAYYAQNHFADVFASMTRAPRGVVERAALIPGVQRAEGGILQYATLDFPHRNVPVRALINSVEEHGRGQLNLLTLRRGHLPRAGEPGQVVVDENFAHANGLDIGSSIDAQIYGNRQRLEITGIGLAPNYIYALAPGDLIPDDSRFGIFWMGQRALEAATDRTEAINTLSLTLERGASEADVIRKLDALLAPYGGTGAYGREDHLSNAFLDNELMQLDAMTKVIPPVFLVVSTFLVYIVLGRMIRTEREQIGLIKAFGYSDWSIGWHYLKFALVVALIATVLGTLAGIWMGRGMTRLYAEYYRFPFLQYRMSAVVIPAGAALSIAAAALGALGGMRSAVKLTPCRRNGAAAATGLSCRAGRTARAQGGPYRHRQHDPAPCRPLAGALGGDGAGGGAVDGAAVRDDPVHGFQPDHARQLLLPRPASGPDRDLHRSAERGCAVCPRATARRPAGRGDPRRAGPAEPRQPFRTHGDRKRGAGRHAHRPDRWRRQRNRPAARRADAQPAAGGQAGRAPRRRGAGRTARRAADANCPAGGQRHRRIHRRARLCRASDAGDPGPRRRSGGFGAVAYRPGAAR